jgi:hypothetical protein
MFESAEVRNEAVVLFFAILYSLVGTKLSKSCIAAIFSVEIKIDFVPHYCETVRFKIHNKKAAILLYYTLFCAEVSITKRRGIPPTGCIYVSSFYRTLSTNFVHRLY